MLGRVTRGLAGKNKDTGKRKKDDGESSRRHPPKQSKPKSRGECDYDSDPEDEDSFYDPAAKSLEPELGFPIPTRRMYNNIKALLGRKIENTRLVCMKSLEELGVADDFRRLTSGIGFSAQFWTLDLKTYRLPTLEFLASLSRKFDDEKEKNYIKFRLSKATYRVWVADIGKTIGFHPNHHHATYVYRGDWQKHDLWRMITGLEDTYRYKSRFIQHPVIRITQRVFAQTIFARGESANQLNDDEGYLLDAMLLENPPKPFLALSMVHHWITARDKGRSGGGVTMGAYITLIAKSLNIAIDTSETCPGPCLMSCKWFSDVHFIQIVKERGLTRYMWKMEGRPDLPLPYASKIDHGPNTWLVPVDYEPGIPVGEQEETPDDAEPMDDEPQSHVPQPPQAYSIPQEQPAWFTQFLNLSLTTSVDARAARELGSQNAEGIARVNERVDIIEQHQVDWGFRYDHGYWPGSDDSHVEQPSYYPPQQIDPFDLFPNSSESSSYEPARLSGEHDFSILDLVFFFLFPPL